MKLTLVFFLILLSTAASASSIYRYVDKKGHVSFSDQPRHDGYIPLVKTWKGWREIAPPSDLKTRILKYLPLVESVSIQYAVSPELISAIVHAESHFNPIAVSSKGAMGLMQLMPGTARDYQVMNRQDPRQNLEGGVRYFKDLLNLFPNNLELAIAAYNAGQNTVIKFDYRIPPYPETKGYVKKVLTLYKHYQNASYSDHLATK